MQNYTNFTILYNTQQYLTELDTISQKKQTNSTTLSPTIQNSFNFLQILQYFIPLYAALQQQTYTNTILYNIVQTCTQFYTTFTQLYKTLHKSKTLYTTLRNFYETFHNCAQFDRIVQNCTALYNTLKQTTNYKTIHYFTHTLQHCTQLSTTLHHFTQLYTVLQTK